MRTITVRQIEREGEYRHIRLFKFPFPDFCDSGFYRMMTSLNAFFYSREKRNWSEEYLFKADDDEDLLARPQASIEYEAERDAVLPVVECDNLYAFFEAIGYDRERKKLVVKPEVNDG